MSSTVKGEINLGLLAECVPGSLLLNILPKFRQEWPQIRFAISYGSDNQLCEDLISDRIHVAVGGDPAPSEFIETHKLGSVSFAAVATPKYLQDKGPFDRVEKLLIADLVDLGSHLPLTGTLMSSQGMDPTTYAGHVHPAFRVPNFHSALEVVMAHSGVAVLPVPLVETRLRCGDLIPLLPELPQPTRKLTLLTRRRTARPLFESVFMEFLLDHNPFKGL